MASFIYSSFRIPENPSLCEAANLGCLDTARRLLDAGASVTTINSEGLNALHCAARNGIVSLVKLFLRRQPGCVVSVCRDKNCTALHYCVQTKSTECTKAVLKYAAKYFDGNHERLQAFMNHQDQHGRTALFETAVFRHFDNARFLIEHGADGSIVNRYGCSAFDCWSTREYENIVGGGASTKAACRRQEPQP